MERTLCGPKLLGADGSGVVGINQERQKIFISCRSSGRNEATRTPDPYVPNVVRYQLRYIPIALQRYTIFFITQKAVSKNLSVNVFLGSGKGCPLPVRKNSLCLSAFCLLLVILRPQLAYYGACLPHLAFAELFQFGF